MINGIKLICFYGPESTGKSVMAKRMAAHFKTEFVPEVAREIVSSNDFSMDDIIKIAKAQNARVIEKAKTANKFLFCDTDLITTQIYCRYYLKTAPLILAELEKEIQYDQYFLFDVDVPWVADDIRDINQPDQRQAMLQQFKGELITRNFPFVLVSGDWDERERVIIETISADLL